MGKDDMAETTNTRLTRIEDKVDKLGEAMISLARAEEKITSLYDNQSNHFDRTNRLSGKIDEIERIVLLNQRAVSFMQKLFWVVLVAVVGAVTTNILM